MKAADLLPGLDDKFRPLAIVAHKVGLGAYTAREEVQSALQKLIRQGKATKLVVGGVAHYKLA